MKGNLRSEQITADPELEEQIFIEARLFWSESDREPHRAILWCERGPRFFGRSVSLIGFGASFLYAHSIESLCDELSDAIGSALLAWRRWCARN